MTQNQITSSENVKPQKSTSKRSKKSKKTKNSGGGRPSPEQIAQLRKERQEKKARRARLLAEDIDPDDPQERPFFIKRKLLEIPHKNDCIGDHYDGHKFTFKIMTYNLLAQTLIRRSMFPDNGPILKWAIRSVSLFLEVKYYNCDVLCMQEMDCINYERFWEPKLKDLGYESMFNHSPGKTHGIAIFFKSDTFERIDSLKITYDSVTTGDIEPRTTTQNVAMLVALRVKKYPNCAILVGTTHLFWHPFGTYERTRQTYILLSKCKEFGAKVQSLYSNIKHVWKFLAGDFNTQPYDSPYLSLTRKPVTYDDRCKRVISCATSFQFSKSRDGGSTEDEEGGNIEKHGENQPKDPVPDSFVATKEQLQLVDKMQALHNSLSARAVSLYSVAYKRVDPENAGLDNARNEPFFSNWAHTWRGLLDYIFVVRSWNKTENCEKIDNLETFEDQSRLILEKLIKMPHPKEMDKGIPRSHEYPSDHLCLIAELSLLTD